MKKVSHADVELAIKKLVQNRKDLGITKEDLKVNNGPEIKEWFLNKEFSVSEKQVYYKSVLKIVKETEKAVQIKMDSKFGVITKWVPKSCMVNL